MFRNTDSFESKLNCMLRFFFKQNIVVVLNLPKVGATVQHRTQTPAKLST